MRLVIFVTVRHVRDETPRIDDDNERIRVDDLFREHSLDFTGFVVRRLFRNVGKPSKFFVDVDQPVE